MLQSLNDWLHQVCPIRRILEVLFPHDSTTGHLWKPLRPSQNFNTVLPHPPYSPTLQPLDLHLFDVLEDSVSEHDYAGGASQDATRIW
jgi:hypothetical protein